MDPKYGDNCPDKIHTEECDRQKRRRPREDGGRGWSHKPEYTWGLQKLEDPRNVTSLRASGRECDSADTLIWDFWHSET